MARYAVLAPRVARHPDALRQIPRGVVATWDMGASVPLRSLLSVGDLGLAEGLRIAAEVGDAMLAVREGCAPDEWVHPDLGVGHVYLDGGGAVRVLGFGAYLTVPRRHGVDADSAALARLLGEIGEVVASRAASLDGDAASTDLASAYPELEALGLRLPQDATPPTAPPCPLLARCRVLADTCGGAGPGGTAARSLASFVADLRDLQRLAEREASGAVAGPTDDPA